jgi:hypothetical protein
MKEYEVDLHIHAFLISAFNGSEWSALLANPLYIQGNYNWRPLDRDLGGPQNLSESSGNEN